MAYDIVEKQPVIEERMTEAFKNNKKKKLALELQKFPSSITHYLRGENLTLEVIIKLSEISGHSIDYLLGREKTDEQCIYLDGLTEEQIALLNICKVLVARSDEAHQQFVTGVIKGLNKLLRSS